MREDGREWAAIHNAGYYYFRRRRATLVEVQTLNVYNPLSHSVCLDEIEESSIEVTSGHDAVEVERVADLPAPHNTEGWLGPASSTSPASAKPVEL